MWELDTDTDSQTTVKKIHSDRNIETISRHKSSVVSTTGTLGFLKSVINKLSSFKRDKQTDRETDINNNQRKRETHRRHTVRPNHKLADKYYKPDSPGFL